MVLGSGVDIFRVALVGLKDRHGAQELAARLEDVEARLLAALLRLLIAKKLVSEQELLDELARG